MFILGGSGQISVRSHLQSLSTLTTEQYSVLQFHWKVFTVKLSFCHLDFLKRHQVYNLNEGSHCHHVVICDIAVNKKAKPTSKIWNIQTIIIKGEIYLIDYWIWHPDYELYLLFFHRQSLHPSYLWLSDNYGGSWNISVSMLQNQCIIWALREVTARWRRLKMWVFTFFLQVAARVRLSCVDFPASSRTRRHKSVSPLKLFMPLFLCVAESAFGWLRCDGAGCWKSVIVSIVHGAVGLTRRSRISVNIRRATKTVAEGWARKAVHACSLRNDHERQTGKSYFD